MQSAHAQTIEELEQQKADLATQQEELESQQAALESELDETSQSLENQREQSALLQQRIEAKSQEIALNQQLIDELDLQISAKEASIAEQTQTIADLENQIDTKYNQLRLRLRSISKTNSSVTALQLIFGSNSYSDYLISFKLSERIAANDQYIMDSLESDITVVNAAKTQNEADQAALETERAALLEVQAEMEAAKLELSALYQESETLAAEMALDVDYLNEQLAAMDAQQDYLQSTIDDVLAQIEAEEERKRQEEEERRRQEELQQQQQQQQQQPGGNEGGYQTPIASAKMVWPAPTCKVITSSYKYRPQFGRYHKGIDIACYGSAQGQPIVAAAAGTVVRANRYDTWGGGYGLYVFIDHGINEDGNRVLTIYAHCSEVQVYEGQQVTAGEQIALIGNTGNSYGAHLHFEVQVGGVDTDPVGSGYLSIADVDVLG